MTHRETIVINCLAGPSSGKTTIAAELFVALKKKGYNVEYLQEYAKQLVWLKEFDVLNNQQYVSHQYYKTIKAMDGVVDYIILDSSLLNGLYYNRNNLDNLSNVDKTEKLILEYYNCFTNLNFFINRLKHIDYETAGRIQSEDEAKAIDTHLIKILEHFNIEYCSVNLENELYIEQMISDINNFKAKTNSKF